MSSSSALLARVLAGCLVLAALPATAVVVPREQALRLVPDQLIVRFRDDAGIVERDAQMMRMGAEPIMRFGRGHNTLLRLPSGSDLERAVARLEASGLVVYAHPNHVKRKYAQCTALAVPKLCPNDPSFNIQYALHNPFLAQSGADSDADMDMPEAWNLITSSSVLLAIIDDGFDLDHPDLDANLQSGVTCNDDNVSCGGSAAAQFDPLEPEAHGTYVAGSAAAVGNNGVGVAGVMWSANVLPIRMEHYTTAEAIMSVDYAIAQGAKVINMSFGGPDFEQGEMDAIDRARQAGILVVAAAGNGDTNIDRTEVNYPANYALDNILAVAASDAADGIAGFSDWGSFSVDLAAAGDGVYTTEVGGGYAGVDGTSFSSPITAGAAALIGQHLINNGNTTWDYHELKARLLVGAENSSDNGELPLRGRVAGGRVNVLKSLEDPMDGAVLVVRGITFDDNVGLSANNDGDGQPDPGETFDMILTLQNLWQAGTDIYAALHPDTLGSTNGCCSSVVIPSIPAFGTATATYRVMLEPFVGNRQIGFELELRPQVPAPGTDQVRYFFIEVGALRNGVEVLQPIQTSNWDEFHAWHANVPAGASNIVFETHTSPSTIDIDLFGRRNATPFYAADLSAGFSFLFCGDPEECFSGAGGASGNETITTSSPGTWHLVVLNAQHTPHTYSIKASWDAAGAGTMRFTGPTSATNESAGNAAIQVVRSGGVGAVSVDYSFTSGSATAGTDFTATNGTLNWANGDIAAKSISVPIAADATSEGNETFTITLSNPTGGADIGRYSVNTVTIANAGAPPPPPSGGGGGGGGGATDALLLAGLAMLLAARRRRPR